MHFHHQQPQVPVQFGGHNQGVVPSSIQMSMGMPGGNASQVQQHMYVQNMQQHQMHQQMLHQGQPMMFPSVGGHQLTPQLGNVSLNMAPQYPQQHQKQLVAPRKNVIKIIDPITNKEVNLGQMASSNVAPQTQQVSGYAAQPMAYFPQQQTSYNQSGMYYPGTTGVGQVPAGSQARYSYQTTQAGQTIPFANPSMSNAAPASHKDNISGHAASIHPQVAGKSQIGLHMEKPVAPVKITVPPAKSDPPKLRVTEHVVPHQQKDNIVLSGTMGSNAPVSEESKAQSVTEKLSQESKAPSVTEKHTRESKAPSVSEKHSKESKAPSVTEKHPTVVTQPSPILATKLENDTMTYPTTNLPSVLSGADGKSKEAIQKTDSIKDNKKNTSRKDTKILPQQPQVFLPLFFS
jgi:translation initiation factor 4G